MVHNTPRNKIDGARLKAMGMVAGVADMIYLRENLPPLFVEFKTDIGRQSYDQKLFQEVAEKTGAVYVLCRDFDHFKSILNA